MNKIRRLFFKNVSKKRPFFERFFLAGGTPFLKQKNHEKSNNYKF